MVVCLRIVTELRRGFPLLIAGLILATNPAVAMAADQPLAGHWQGAIEIPGKSLSFDVDFSSNKDGSWKGDVTIPAQGARDLPLAKIVVEGFLHVLPDRRVQDQVGSGDDVPQFERQQSAELSSRRAGGGALRRSRPERPEHPRVLQKIEGESCFVHGTTHFNF